METTTTTPQQPQQQAAKTTGLSTQQANISEQVLARISQFQQDGSLRLPESYIPSNHIKSAWLALQEAADRTGKPVLQVCTRESIANALLDMVLQGLAVSKKQGYFIAYGNKLLFQRSYFDTMALARQAGGMQGNPVANVIYEGDNFVYTIDPDTGRTRIVKHEQSLDNIDNTKIKGAYAIVTDRDGNRQVTIMNIAQIHASWQQGATKGGSPAHKNFAEEMCKKTVIGRACKAIINASDDSWIFDGKADEDDTDATKEQREAKSRKQREEVKMEEADYTEVPAEPAPAQQPAEDGPDY